MNDDNFAFDFKIDPLLPQCFAADYLRQYYSPDRPVTDDERSVFNFIKKVSPTLKQLNSMIEVGCGPTVHHAIMLAPFVEQIDLADYLDVNLSFVSSWISKGSDCWNWNSYTRFCLSEEGLATTDEAIEHREDLTRHRIKRLRMVNLLSEAPLGNFHFQYDLIATFYCTEEISLTVERWKEVICTTTKLVKPGGFLLMSCLKESDFYVIQGADGSVRSLPCARITESDLMEGLSMAGYDLSQTIMTSEQTPSQRDEGVPGVFIVLSRLAA